MEVAASKYDTELSRRLAASVDYSLDVCELQELSKFLASWKRLVEEIEQLYHDGRVLQVLPV